MRTKISLLIGLIFIFLYQPHAFPEKIDGNRLKVIIEQAEQLCRTGFAYDAIKIAEQVLKSDKNCAPAYQVIAKAHLSLNTPIDRTRAAEAIEKALAIDPGNPDFHMTYVDIMIAQDFRENAKKYLEAMLREFSDYREALFRYAELSGEDYARLKNLVSGEPQAVFNQYFLSEMQKQGYSVFQARIDMDNAAPPLEFRKFADSELERARKAYAMLGNIDSAYKDIDRQMALLAYRAEDWNGVAQAAVNWLRKKTDSRDAWLLLGLGFHRDARYAEADSAFREFRRLTPETDRMLYDFFNRFLSVDEQVRIQGLASYQREDYHHSFWESRDPLHLTEYNERLLEHYARVAEANLLFSDPAGGEMQGWKSDRGQIWVRYGPPKDIYRNLNLANREQMLSDRSEMESIPYEARFHFKHLEPIRIEKKIEPEANIDERLLEYWCYDRFTLVFYEFPLWSGKGAFANTFGLNFKEIAERLQREISDSYSMRVKGKRIVFPYYAVDFRGRKGGTDLRLFYEFPLSGIEHQGTNGKYYGKIRQGTFLYNQYWNPAYTDTKEMESVSPMPVDSTSEDRFFAANNVEIRPGKYNLAIEVMDVNSNNVGAIHAPLEIESYSYDSLAVSDLLLAKNITVDDKTDSVSLATLAYLPNVSRVYKKSDGIFLYFEVYNLRMDGVPGTTDYRVEYSLLYKKSEEETSGNPLSVLGKLFNFSKREYEIATAADYTGDRPVENLYLELDSAPLAEGMYQLTLSIFDRRAGCTARKEAEFMLVK